MADGPIFKAKITTSHGTFEFEGSQTFVESQVDKIVDIEKSTPLARPQALPQDTPEPQHRGRRNTGGGTSRKPSAQQPKMLPELVAKDKINVLKDFYAQKSPATQIETYAVLTYWLKENTELDEVSIDEMWTLYRVLSIKAPKVLVQAFRDGKSKKGYFELGTTGRYHITSVGETFVEHDLPHNAKSK